jgi:hypothetical protein
MYVEWAVGCRETRQADHTLDVIQLGNRGYDATGAHLPSGGRVDHNRPPGEFPGRDAL